MKRRRTVKIIVHDQAESQSVEASVIGLDRHTRHRVYTAIHMQAMELLRVRVGYRRFRPPLEVHFVQDPTTLHANTVTGCIEAKDARGRAASVRVEIKRGRLRPANP